MNRPVEKALGVDIGGTKTAVAVVDRSLKIFHSVEFSTPGDPAEASGRIKDEVRKLDPAGDLPVGIALCGLLSRDGTKLLMAPNLKWKNILIEDMFGWIKSPYTAVNDGTAAAWACYVSESGSGVSNLLSVTMGTGVGGGIIIGGSLLFGAGELGHVKLDPEGPPCGCGSRGCLETFIGGSYIPSRASDWCGLSVKTADEMFEMACGGDGKSLECWRRIGALAGYALSGVVNLNGIEEISLGGTIATSAGRFFLDTLKGTLTENLMVPESQRVNVHISRWKQNMSLAGAGAVVIEPPANKPCGA